MRFHKKDSDCIYYRHRNIHHCNQAKHGQPIPQTGIEVVKTVEKISGYGVSIFGFTYTRYTAKLLVANLLIILLEICSREVTIIASVAVATVVGDRYCNSI